MSTPAPAPRGSRPPPPPLPPLRAQPPPPPANEVDAEVVVGQPVSESDGCMVEIALSALPEVPLFSDLPRDVFLALIADSSTIRSAKAGEPIVREGERGDAMFVIAEGSVRVVRSLGAPDERVVARMAAGAFFGEFGLLADAPRLASVVAEEECTLLEVTRAQLSELEARFPKLQPLLQRFFKVRLFTNLLRSAPLFQALSTAETRVLVDRFAIEKARPGATLLTEGEPGRGLFVLLRGRCEVFHTDTAGATRTLGALDEGDVFGEISLLLDTPATATVRADGPCLLLSLDREAFEECLMKNDAVAAQLEALGKERLTRSRLLLAGERVQMV